MLEDCDPLATIFLISMWLSGSVLSFIPMSFNLIPKSGLVNGISPAWPYSSTSWPIVISPNWDLAICELFWLMKTNPFYYTYNFLFLCSVVGPTFRLNLKAIRLDVYFIDFLRGHRTHNQPWFAIFFLCLRPNLPPSIAIKVRFFRVPPSQMVANFWGSAFLFGEFLASKDLKAQHTFRIFRGRSVESGIIVTDFLVSWDKPDPFPWISWTGRVMDTVANDHFHQEIFGLPLGCPSWGRLKDN